MDDARDAKTAFIERTFPPSESPGAVEKIRIGTACPIIKRPVVAGKHDNGTGVKVEFLDQCQETSYLAIHARDHRRISCSGLPLRKVVTVTRIGFFRELA